MAETLQTRVQAYTGTVPSTAVLTDILTAGAASIVNLIPEHKLDRYAADVTDSGSGADVTGHRILRAHKSGYNARRVDPGLKTQVLPTGALSTTTIVSGGTGYALNDVLTLSQGTSGTLKVTSVSAGVVTSVQILTSGSAFTEGLKTTTVVPSGGSNCTIYVIPTNASIYQAITTSPVYYIENTKGYVIPGGGTLIGVPFPTVAYGDTSISSFPKEWTQGVILYAAIQTLLGKSNTILDSLNNLLMDTTASPSVPSVASYTFTDAIYSNATYTVASYTDVTPTTIVYSPATIDVTTATTIAAIPTAPVYTKPVSSFNISNAITDISTNEDLEKAQTELSKQTTLIEQHGKDQYNELNKFNTEIQNQQIAVNHLIEQARLDQQRLIDQSQKVVQLNEFNAQRILETATKNVELALQASIQNESKTMELDLQNKIKAMELDLQNKSKAAEIDILNKTKTLEKQISENQSNLQRYSEQLASYAQDINKAVQKYSNSIQKSLGVISSNESVINQCRTELKMILSMI